MPPLFDFIFPKRHPSVFFFTLHKSASTLFGNVVLPNISNLKHVDFASQIYSGELKSKPVFEKQGFIYGPIRVWQEPDNPESQLLLEPVLETDFLRRIKCLLFIRDPRDVLVSFYFSVAATHGVSDVPEIARLQEQRRSEALELGIDAFCVQTAPKILENYSTIRRIQSLGKEKIMLRYEDMIEDFSTFSANLRTFVPVEDKVMERLFHDSRPLERENTSHHKRSGAIGSFHNKLQPQTIEKINHQLQDVLVHFRYLTLP